MKNEWKIVKDLLKNCFDGTKFIPFLEKVQVVVNDKLTEKFHHQRHIYEKRWSVKGPKNPFWSDSWKNDHLTEREAVLKHYNTYAGMYCIFPKLQ